MTENVSIPSLFELSVVALCHDGTAYTNAFGQDSDLAISKYAKTNTHQVACKFYAHGGTVPNENFRENVVMMRNAWNARNYAFLEAEMNLRQKLHVLDETPLYIKIATWAYYHQYERCIRIRNQHAFTVATRVAFDTKNSKFAKRLWVAGIQDIDKNSVADTVKTFCQLLSVFVMDAIEHDEWSTLYNYARRMPSICDKASITARLRTLDQSYFFVNDSPIIQQPAYVVYAKMRTFRSFFTRVFSYDFDFVHRDAFVKQWNFKKL